MGNRIIALSVLLFILFSGLPVRSQQYAQLDEAFRKDLKKVKQYPRSPGRIAQLEASYEAVTRADSVAMASLRATGEPDIWYNMYRILLKIDKRQKELMALPEPTLRQMNYTYKDMGNEILENKNKASAYFYAHANKMLGEDKPEAARMAYHDLVLLASLSDGYKDLDILIRKAVLEGATDIHYELYNHTGRRLNTKIVNELSSAVYTYRQERLKKGSDQPAGRPMPFIIRIYLTDLLVGNDALKKSNYTEERTVFKNNVAVDTIRCNIDQYKQEKGVLLKGRVDIYDETMKSVINTIPIKAQKVFVHSYATLKGNPDAAGDQTRALLTRQKIKFPSDGSMVMDATKEFTNQVEKVLLP